MASLEEKIWFCGFYEGEGSVSNDKCNNNRIRLCISQNDITPLNIGKNIWGGSVRPRIRESKNKTCYGNEWTLGHNAAVMFINDIKPYMRIPYKILQIETVLDKWKLGWDGEYRCNFCNNTYASTQGRRRHEKHIHISNGTKHTCNICDAEYDYKDSLTRHIKTHVSNSVASETTVSQDFQNAGNSLES